MSYRDTEPFLPWLVKARCAAELHLIQAVTGQGDNIPVDGFPHPADAAEFAAVVDLVEQHNLRDLLCVVASTDVMWWRIAAHWDRLVALLDTASPRWRDGKITRPDTIDAYLSGIYNRPQAPRRVLLDMDGPLADFDALCYEVCDIAGWRTDRPLDARTARYMTDHMPHDGHRDALKAIINSDGWYRSLPVTPGAQEGVEALLAAGHDVVVCSKPHEANENCEPEKKAWLAEHFPMLRHRYIFTPDKSLAHAPGGILLDDAIVADQATANAWDPVVFAEPFNGPDTPWGRWPRWTWGDPIERIAW